MEILVETTRRLVAPLTSEQQANPSLSQLTRQNQGKEQLQGTLLGSKQTSKTGLKNYPALMKLDQHGAMGAPGHC